MAIGLGPFFLTWMGRAFHLPLYANIMLIPITMASAVASLILSGIALRPVAASDGGAAGSRSAWRVGARICLLAAPLVALVVAAALAFAAQFIVGFYLHLVF